MSGCGNIQKLVEPKVIEKKIEVPVPAPFSWKGEFTGKRCAAKVIELVSVGALTFFAYKYGRSKGMQFFENMSRAKALENLVLSQTLAGVQAELANLHTVVDQIKANNVALEERYQAALQQIQALGQ